MKNLIQKQIPYAGRIPSVIPGVIPGIIPGIIPAGR